MKNPFIFLLVVLLSFLSLACRDKNIEEERMTGITVIQNVNIRVKNSNGIDLLDPGNENGIKSYKIYYLVNGEKKLYNQPLLDASGGYRLLKHPTGGHYYLQVLMDGGKGVVNAITYLQLGTDSEMAEIKTLYKSDPDNVIPENIWYNNNLVWNSQDGEPTFEIIKP